MIKENVFSKRDLNFLVKLKAFEFKKDNENVNEDKIKEYLFNIKWKKVASKPMCDLIDDIMGLQFTDVFDYLSVQAVKEANDLDLSNFEELISK